jgi:hypothetical protein
MKANELRIGNLTHINMGNKSVGDKWTMCVVKEIYSTWTTPNHFYDEMGSFKVESPFNLLTVSEQTIHGIPLTEEWLLKLGFHIQSVSKHDFKYHKVNRTDKIYTTNPFNLEDIDTFEIEVIKDGDDNQIRRIGIKDINYCDASNIQHVHQLQNIYFALTGEELTINEEN